MAFTTSTTYYNPGLQPGWRDYDSFNDYWKSTGYQTKGKYIYKNGQWKKFSNYMPESIKQMMQRDYNKAKERQRAEQKMESVYSEYQNAYNEAKQANLERYQQILGNYDTMYEQQKEMIGNMGNAEKQELKEIAGKGYARNADTVVKSGMLGTTVKPALDRQVSKDHARNVANVNERLNQAKLNSYGNYMQGKMGVMERRTDSYPEMGNYLQLMQMYGNYGTYGS